MKKIIIRTQGLTCDGCAKKIQKKINDVHQFQDAVVDPMKGRIEASYHEYSEGQAFNAIKEIVDNTEKGVVLSLNKAIKKAKWYESKELKLIVLSLIVFFAGNLAGEFKPVFEFIAYLIVGYDVLTIAFKNILKGEVFDEKFLMTIATIGALVINEIPEAYAVMLFYSVGEWFQDQALSHSISSIEALIETKLDTVHILENNNVKDIDASDVEVGMLMQIRKGEKVGVDGTLLSEEAYFDQSSLNGESIPKKVLKGDRVLAGWVATQASCEVEAIATYQNSTMAKMGKMIDEASAKKAKSEQFITRFAKIYTPIVVVIAIALFFIILFLNGSIDEAIYRSAIFLVISCPCALVLSVPLSFFAAIGRASSFGVMVKGGQYLERLAELKTLAFDKTGTLTLGDFKVQKIDNKDISETQFINVIKALEVHSTHPIATAINRLSGSEALKATNVNELSGLGISGVIDGETYFFGNNRLMLEQGFEVSGQGLHLATSTNYYGEIIVDDTVKTTAKSALAHLKKMGIKLVLLSGDRKAKVEKVANELGIENAYSELLPEDKMAHLESLKQESDHLGFIGDGINDALALKVADVGIAMGALGSDLAIESADIILMNDDLNSISKTVNLAKKTKRIVIMNIAFVLLIKVVVLGLGAFGEASMWEAIFADVGVSLIAILNSMRLLKVRVD